MANPFEGFTVHLEAGETVYQEGEVGTMMYVVQSGAVELYRQVNGQRISYGTLEKGDFFGEMSLLLERQPRTTSAVGVYHTGVERKWWAGPTSCTGGGDISNLSPADLLNQINAAPMVRCDEIPWLLSDLIPWDVLNLSMANFNAVGALVTALIWIAAARRA